MASIFKNMVPDACYKKFSDIPFEDLFEQGFRTVLLDYDNTLGPDRTTEPTEYSFEIIKKLKELGFKLCLVSNAKSQRSKGIAEALDIPCVTCANKPGIKGIISAIELTSSDKKECIMVGDQVFTDVIAGKRAGVYTVFVEKFAKKEIWYVKIKRPFEKLVRIFASF